MNIKIQKAEHNNMDVAERLNKRASELGIKQASIAKQLQLTRGSVNQWFNGSTKPGGDNLIRLAKILRTSPDWIVSGKGSPDTQFSSTANIEMLKKAAKIIRNAELLSGKPFEVDEFAEKLAEIYFRLESNLSLEGVINNQSSNVEKMKQASVNAQEMFDKVLSRPGLRLTTEEKKALYSRILNDSYEAILINDELDEKNYING